jgi:hypothetical protein
VGSFIYYSVSRATRVTVEASTVAGIVITICAPSVVSYVEATTAAPVAPVTFPSDNAPFAAGMTKLITVAVSVPMASGPEEPITRTFTVFPRHPAPVVAFVSALFIPVSVTVLTLKYVVALFQVSSIAVVIPVESQATAARDPCPNSIGDAEPKVIDAAKVLPKYVTAISVMKPAKILVRLRVPRPPNREPIRPLSGELFAIADYSSLYV